MVGNALQVRLQSAIGNYLLHSAISGHEGQVIVMTEVPGIQP